jgi:hypothetical protein
VWRKYTIEACSLCYVGHCGVFIIVAFIVCTLEMISTFLAWRADYKMYTIQFQDIYLKESGTLRLVR